MVSSEGATAISAPPVSPSSSEAGQSETSIVVYGQEPFEQYVSRVKDLINIKWPSVADEDITVERMKGGGFNRVIDVLIPDKYGPERGQYVLRIPRFETAQMLNDLASLEFINRWSDIPVPEVVASECTTQNVLESPYMIQRRLRGNPLISLYSEMGHESRCQTARQLGEALASLTSLQIHRIGKLASSNDEVGQPQFLVQVLDGTGPTASWLYSDAPATQDTSEALREIFDYQNDMAMAAVDDFRSEYTQHFAAMTSQIGDMGYLQDIPISLCHLDFERRNILIDLQDQAKPDSGIIDWDSAVFAPSFVSCTPSMWIWA